MITCRTVDCGGIAVSYTDELDGGGQEFGLEYVPLVQKYFSPECDVLEWCSGPGFMGFSLLGQGLCASLTLVDINADAIAACDTTVRRNGLQDRVSTFHSDCFSDIATDQKWDLVIGNPPHVNTSTPGETDFQRRKPQVIYLDRDWAIHRRFYNEVGKFLRPGGSVALREKYTFSSPETFYPMIAAGRLDRHRVIQCPAPYEEYYFIWSRLTDDRATFPEEISLR